MSVTGTGRVRADRDGKNKNDRWHLFKCTYSHMDGTGPIRDGRVVSGEKNINRDDIFSADPDSIYPSRSVSDICKYPTGKNSRRNMTLA